MRSLLAAGVLGLMAGLFAAASQGTASGPAVSLQDRIDRAQPGDTLEIKGGTYNERLVIDKPLELKGTGDPVIDGGGEGDVITILADNVTVSRLVIRNSGRAISQEPAAIKVLDAHEPVIKHNQIQESHFGIHVTGSHHATIDGNEIDLGHTNIERRGHAIYLWEVSESVVHDNTIENAADGIHLEFSQDNDIVYNSATGSRYALHFMYSDNNRILQNAFTDNLAGAVLMFSHNLLLKDNELSSNRQGATGTGILLKDVDDIFVEGNTIIRNKYGLTADGSPQSKGATAVFMKNLFALNDTGLGLMSNSPITFVENAMIENTVQVQAMGGALASSLLAGHGGGVAAHDGGSAKTAEPPEGISWVAGGRGNYWSDYAGYDRDGDAVGDVPYAPQPAFAGALDDNDRLRLFQFTLAQEAIDMAADMFPVYRYDAVMEDGAPLMSPPGPALATGGEMNRNLLAVSIALVAVSGLALAFILEIDPARVVAGAASRLRARRAS